MSSKLEYCWRRRAGLEGFIARIRDEEFDGHDILAPSILDRLKRATEGALELGREQGLEMESIEANEDYAEDIWDEFVKPPYHSTSNFPVRIVELGLSGGAGTLA